jgi:hypothetical protein
LLFFPFLSLISYLLSLFFSLCFFSCVRILAELPTDTECREVFVYSGLRSFISSYFLTSSGPFFSWTRRSSE